MTHASGAVFRRLAYAQLEVGVLSTNGNAIKDMHVGLDCQGKDITGKPIAFSPHCGNPIEWCSVSFATGFTDATGLTTIFLAPGTYMIRLGSHWGTFQLGDQPFIESNVELLPGETKRIIITDPKQ